MNIRKTNGGKTVTEITTRVEIADKTGHTVLHLSKAETISRAAESEGSWVFAGNQWWQLKSWLIPIGKLLEP